MSSGFRGARPDIETGFAGVVPDQRHAMRICAARPTNTNSFAFLFTVFLLFMILNSNQISPNFLVWLVFGVFLVAAINRVYETCRQLQAQARVLAGGSNDALLGQTELRLHMASSLAIAARGGIQGLRLQLALLGHNIDELEFETMGAVDPYNASLAPSMSEEEINALPVHKYRITGQGSEDSLQQQSSSSPAAESNQVFDGLEASSKPPGDGLTCSVCLEQVHEGEIVRTLPCLHQFHSNCIDPWLRQQGTCPVCKFRANEWQQVNDPNTGIYDGSPTV